MTPSLDHDYRPSPLVLYRHGFEPVPSDQEGLALYRRSAPIGSHDVRVSPYSFSLHAEKTGDVRLHGLCNVHNDDDFDTLLRLIGW